MVCLAELLRTEEPNLPLDFGKVCIKPWVPSKISVQLITHIQMAKQKG
jgi:hypothetical protein